MQEHPYPLSQIATFVTPPLIGSRCRIDWHKRSMKTSRSKDSTMPMAVWKSPQRLTEQERFPRSSVKARIIRERQSRRNYSSVRIWDLKTGLGEKTEGKKRLKSSSRKSSMKRESRETWTNRRRRLRSKASSSEASLLPNKVSPKQSSLLPNKDSRTSGVSERLRGDIDLHTFSTLLLLSLEFV